ncbi:hypothetical protein AOLI_G00002600 [Acnodon oligacanthus]
MEVTEEGKGVRFLLMCWPRKKEKKSKKVLLKEMEEELRREINTRESLQEQWKMERKKWIEETEKLEKLREAENEAGEASEGTSGELQRSCRRRALWEAEG